MKTATKTTKCICVWQDETDGSWIVSRDEVDFASNATSYTATLSVHATEEEATEAAKTVAAKSKLTAYLFESASDGYGRGNRYTAI